MKGEKLTDMKGETPFKALFYDPKDQNVKQITVTEKALDNTLKTFADTNNVSRNVVFKYMSKHDTIQPEVQFNGS